MNQKYIGKTCPYCQFPVKKLDDLLVCPDCKQPHHPDCWKENDGCTTFSCECKAIPQERSNNTKLNINLEDLPVDDYGSVIYPSLSNQTSKGSDYDKNGISSILWQLSIGGFIGGVIVWLFALEYFDFAYYARTELYNQSLIERAAFAAILGAAICAALSSVEGITSKVSSKIVSGIVTGAVIGSVGGFLGTYIGDFIFAGLSGSQATSDLENYMFRGLFWGSVGLFIGLGQGIGTGGGKRNINGLIGGLIGGFIAGFLFDYFFLIFSSASLSGFIAISVFGVSVAVAIGTVQELRKEAWFKVIEGATFGKEYILYSDKTIIGSSPQCDIVLIKDPLINNKHVEIRVENSIYIIERYSGANNMVINERIISRGQIKNGDILKLGSYQMRFNEKVVK